jgi:hypothetical protein
MSENPKRRYTDRDDIPRRRSDDKVPLWFLPIFIILGLLMWYGAHR